MNDERIACGATLGLEDSGDGPGRACGGAADDARLAPPRAARRVGRAAALVGWGGAAARRAPRRAAAAMRPIPMLLIGLLLTFARVYLSVSPLILLLLAFAAFKSLGWSLIKMEIISQQH